MANRMTRSPAASTGCEASLVRPRLAPYHHYQHPFMTSDKLPVLSWASYLSASSRPDFLAQLRSTLSTVGFFYLVDFEDAVSSELFERCSRVSKTFWDLPLEVR